MAKSKSPHRATNIPGSHKPLRKSDLAKALAAAAQVGLPVARFEITEGKIIVFAGPPEQDEICKETSDDLRKLL